MFRILLISYLIIILLSLISMKVLLVNMKNLKATEYIILDMIEDERRAEKVLDELNVPSLKDCLTCLIPLYHIHILFMNVITIFAIKAFPNEVEDSVKKMYEENQ